MQWGLTRLALQAARRTWRPKRLPNRVPNPKKSMLKNNTFLASILRGFGPGFGRVFNRFFGSKMDAKSDLKKSARQAKSIGKTNTKSMSALLRQSVFQAKINEKSHVFWDFDFKWILGGFWEGFGRPKSLIFALFSMFFRCLFSSAVRKAKKSTKNAKKPNFSAFWRRVCGGPQAPGERKG